MGVNVTKIHHTILQLRRLPKAQIIYFRNSWRNGYFLVSLFIIFHFSLMKPKSIVSYNQFPGFQNQTEIPKSIIPSKHFPPLAAQEQK